MTWVGSLCFEQPLSVLSLLSFGVCCGLSLYHCFCLYRVCGKSCSTTEETTETTPLNEEVTPDSDKVEPDFVVSKKGKGAPVKEDMKGQ